MGSKDDSSLTTEVDDRLDSFFGDEEDEPKEGFQGTSTTAEVNNRLDDLFGTESKSAEDDGPQPDDRGDPVEESNPPAEPEPGATTAQISSYDTENSILKELKSVVLSLEWEITDQVMQRLGEEIARLEKECKDDKIVVAFLQLLSSLGKYIQKKRAEAHPDSISLLNSVYDSMEKVVLSDDLADTAKKKMLIAEVNKYKLLKEQIATTKTAPPRKVERRAPVEAVAPEAGDVSISPDEPEPSVVDFAPHADEESVVSEPAAAPVSAGVAVSNQEVISAISQLNETIKSGLDAIREELRLLREQQQQ